MRRLLLAIPFALLPLAMAHAADDHDHEHASLGAHEHGAGSLDVALDGQTLELDLDGPSMNLVGFEHLATTDADKAKVVQPRPSWAIRWCCSTCPKLPSAALKPRTCRAHYLKPPLKRLPAWQKASTITAISKPTMPLPAANPRR